MPFVSGGKKLFAGDVNAFPRCAPCRETLDCRPAGDVILLLSRHQMGNRLAVAGDRDCLAALNCAQEL